MKKWFIGSILLMMMAVPMAGCATFKNDGANWQDNLPRLEADIFMFSKLATRIALSEANIVSDDVELVKGYLVALGDLLAVPGKPNFVGARALVGTKLPSKYRIYGLTIIDVIERYLMASNLDVTTEQKAIMGLVSAGIDGAIAAVQEFAR